MPSLNKFNGFNFWFVAVLLIVTTALVFVVSLPQIQAAQGRGVDTLLAQAKTQPDQSTAILEQAVALSGNDPLAIEALAQNYRDRGEYAKVLQAYQTAPTINPIYLGNLAMQFSLPAEAKKFFERGVKNGEEASGEVGLSLSEYALGNISAGCTHAEQAVKLDLASERAKATQQICEVLNNKSVLPERQQAYLLLNNYIFEAGETKLKSVKIMAVGDYQLLASVQASHGNLSDAIANLKKGLELEPSNVSLLTAMVEYLQRSGRAGEQNEFQLRLTDTQFSRSQN